MWPFIKKLLYWKAPAIHLTFCIVLFLVVLLAVDGYKALDGPGTSRSSNGSFRFRSSDIITLLSAAMTVNGVTSAAWSGAVLWKCVTVVWHRNTIPKSQDLKEVKWILEYNVQRWTWNKLRRPAPLDRLIALALLPIIPQLLSSPLLEGSVDWESSSEFGAKVFVASKSSTANFARWRWYSAGAKMSDAEVKVAAGFAGVAWENATESAHQPRSKRCRHVVNDDQFRVGSALHNVTIPCIIIHNISWPTAVMPDAIQAIFNNSAMITATGEDPFANADNPGIAVLFDPTNTTLKIPPQIGQRNTSVNPSVAEPIYPSPFLFSGKMIAIVQLIKKYPYEPRLLDPFGYLKPNNNITTGFIVDLEAGQVEGDNCYTYLEVDFTAGVAMPETSTYITSKFVESGPLDPVNSDIYAGPWVKEALYMMPDVMVTVAIMNNTSLDTWNNIANYTENLIRSSYLGAWDMLNSRFDPNNTNLTASLAEPRLQASVSKAKIAGWLVIQALFTLTFLPIMLIQWEDENVESITGPVDFVEQSSPEAGDPKANKDEESSLMKKFVEQVPQTPK